MKSLIIAIAVLSMTGCAGKVGDVEFEVTRDDVTEASAIALCEWRHEQALQAWEESGREGERPTYDCGS